jgi:hypothetical protein
MRMSVVESQMEQHTLWQIKLVEGASAEPMTSKGYWLNMKVYVAVVGREPFQRIRTLPMEFSSRKDSIRSSLVGPSKEQKHASIRMRKAWSFFITGHLLISSNLRKTQRRLSICSLPMATTAPEEVSGSHGHETSNVLKRALAICLFGDDDYVSRFELLVRSPAPLSPCY